MAKIRELPRRARPPRLYEAVAERLARAIAAGAWKPGERLPAERELAATYDVSRPTLREAVIALELDGVVEVRVGSGVYVTGKPRGAGQIETDIGPFELTEARLLFEGEVAAMAASSITDAELDELERLVADMAAEKRSEAAERIDFRFHVAVADATHNSAMTAVVEHLWTIRNRSPQCVVSFEKSRARGNLPVPAEHQAIVDALRTRDPGVARGAMRAHLRRVLSYLLDATESEAIEAARAQVNAQRARFARGLA